MWLGVTVTSVFGPHGDLQLTYRQMVARLGHPLFLSVSGAPYEYRARVHTVRLSIPCAYKYRAPMHNHAPLRAVGLSVPCAHKYRASTNTVRT